MRLGVSWITNGRKPTPRRLPLRTVTEIAEMLGVSKNQMVIALRATDAPKPTMRSREFGHMNSRVWYEPGEVMRWWRARA